jgi:hypothetical protein
MVTNPPMEWPTTTAAPRVAARATASTSSGPDVGGVHLAPVAVAVTGQVERHDAPVGGQQRCERRPPPGVGGAAVDEHERRRVRVSPREVAHHGVADGHLPRFPGVGDGLREPPRRSVGHLDVGRVEVVGGGCVGHVRPTSIVEVRCGSPGTLRCEPRAVEPRASTRR